MRLSIVIPAYDEQDNIKPLYEELKPVLESISTDHEIIFVDDGSRDMTFSRIIELHRKDPKVRAIKFRRNYGQGAALDAGFKRAKGEVIVYMDADLQMDPRDLPQMIEKLKEGYDAVIGWRWKRKDSFAKKLASKLAGFVRNVFAMEKVHDAGCPLKVMRREAAKRLELGGEMHRYIYWLLVMQGFRVAEMKVNHRPRRFGKSKYGIARLPKGFLDLILIKFWMEYRGRPIHLFGGVGLVLAFFGFIAGIWLLIEKFVYGESIAGRPMLQLSILLLVLGVQSLFFGIMMDALIKIYESKKGPGYSIERVI